MTPDKELDALVERLLAMHCDEGGAIIVHETASAISALRKERGRLREALRGIYAHTGVSANAMSMAAIDSLLGSIERLCEGALETDHMRKATENDPFCIRNGVADVVNGVNETTLPQIDTNDDCAPCSALAPQEPTT